MEARLVRRRKKRDEKYARMVFSDQRRGYLENQCSNESIFTIVWLKKKRRKK